MNFTSIQSGLTAHLSKPRWTLLTPELRMRSWIYRNTWKGTLDLYHQEDHLKICWSLFFCEKNIYWSFSGPKIFIGNFPIIFFL